MESDLWPVDGERCDSLTNEDAEVGGTTTFAAEGRCRGRHGNAKQKSAHAKQSPRSVNQRSKHSPSCFLPPGAYRFSQIRHRKYAGIPARMILNVTPLSLGLVMIAFAIIPTDASRKSAGVTGYPQVR